MTALLENRRSEVYQLLLMGVMTTTAVALSYDYVVTTGTTKAFFAIIGIGLLLALLVMVPALLTNQK
jgi:hypothetical protein